MPRDTLRNIIELNLKLFTQTSICEGIGLASFPVPPHILLQIHDTDTDTDTALESPQKHAPRVSSPLHKPLAIT